MRSYYFLSALLVSTIQALPQFQGNTLKAGDDLSSDTTPFTVNDEPGSDGEVAGQVADSSDEALKSTDWLSLDADNKGNKPQKAGNTAHSLDSTPVDIDRTHKAFPYARCTAGHCQVCGSNGQCVDGQHVLNQISGLPMICPHTRELYISIGCAFVNEEQSLEKYTGAVDYEKHPNPEIMPPRGQVVSPPQQKGGQ